LQGVPTKLDIFAFNDSLVSRPQPFNVQFQARTDAQAKIIVEEAEKALEELQRYAGETKVTMESASENFTEQGAASKAYV
jgi:hypothetical protein